jgi:hypothetical protein
MNLSKNTITFLILLFSLLGASAVQDINRLPVNVTDQEPQTEIEQIILSYIDTNHLDIQPDTPEYALFMKGILLSEYPELSSEGSAYVENEETRIAILDYAWEHMATFYEGSQFDPKIHPVPDVKNLDLVLDNQSLQLVASSYDQNRASAIEYAYLWSQQGSSKRNPIYPDFGDNDCTNFVSQAMFAGGYPKIGNGDGCKQESTFTEWYVNANLDPSIFCTGDFREWEWATPWSLSADYREYFAHQSSNAIEFGYTENRGVAAYYLVPGDVVQLMSQSGEN